MRIFTPSAELPFAGPPRAGHGVRGRSGTRRRRRGAGDGRGSVSVSPERDGGQSCSAGWPADPGLGAVHPRARAARRPRRGRLPAAGRALPHGPLHVYVGSQRGRRRRARAGHGRPEEPGRRCELLRRRGRSWKTRMFCPSAGVPRTRRPARRPGRSRSTWPATAGSHSARRSRSARARRSGGHRCCTQGHRRAGSDQLGRGRRRGHDRRRGPGSDSPGPPRHRGLHQSIRVSPLLPRRYRWFHG